MPSGYKIDWSLYDDLIRIELPKHTIEEFTKQFLPNISTKAIGSRARKLNIQPAAYKCTIEHKAKIAAYNLIETPELVDQIRQLRDIMSNSQLYKHLGITHPTLMRIINRHNIKLSSVGEQRALQQCRDCSKGKIPWNKGGELSDETKVKISEALKGEKNGQFGRGMTEEEVVRWREAYQARGIHKMREWLKTEDGKATLLKSNITTKTPEFAAKMSIVVADRIVNGEFQPHSHHVHGWYESSKAGHVYYRSSYELSYFQYLDNNDNILEYDVEPFRIPYEFSGSRNYIPDTLIIYNNGSRELVEVKPSALLSQPKNAAKIIAGRSYCDVNNIVFVVITEEDLESLI